MHFNNITKGKHITKSERQLIGMWKNQEKLSNRAIAKRLGKAPQTIHNEIKRGWIDLAYSGGETEYSWQVAQKDYDKKREVVGATDTWTPKK